MTTSRTATIIDAVGRVCAQAVGGEDHVFAAGVTDAVTDAEPNVVPLADDFSEAGMPAVTLALGRWLPTIQPGNERLTLTLEGALWTHRVPLGENTAVLYALRDALVDAFLAHGLAYLHEASVDSVVLKGGPGIRARSLPRGARAEGSGERLFLTLPFTVEIKCNRAVSPQPA